jgi:hypothetical protein
MFDVVLRSYLMSHASELKLNKSDEVQDDIRGLKTKNAPYLNGIPQRALKNLSQPAVSLLA